MRQASEVSCKLREIGGEGPWKVRLDRIVEATGWRDGASRNRIRHLIKLEQKPSPEQVNEVRAAHARFCAVQIGARHRDDARLAQEIMAFIHRARHGDPAFFEGEMSGSSPSSTSSWRATSAGAGGSPA